MRTVIPFVLGMLLLAPVSAAGADQKKGEALVEACMASETWDADGHLCLAKLADDHTDDGTLSWEALVEHCNAFSMAGISECLTALAVVSEKKLKKANADLAAASAEYFRSDDVPDHSRRAKKNQAAAYQEFPKFRKLHCEYVATSAGGGIGLTLPRKRCEIDLNLWYADQLRLSTKKLLGLIEENK